MNDFIEQYANAKETSQDVQEVEFKAAETPIETKVETEVKVDAEVKTEAEEIKTEVVQPSLFDKFAKPNEEVTTEPKAEEVKTEVVVEPTEQLVALQAELEKYKSNPLAKLLGGDYDITNLDIKDFLKKAVGEDFTNLSDDALIEKSLSANPLFDALTDEEKQEEIDLRKERLEGMSKLEKLQHRNTLISELEKSKDTNEIFKTLQEIQTQQKETIANPDEWYQEKVNNDFETRFNEVKQAITNNAKSLIGQEYKVNNFSYKVTEEDAASMDNAYVNEVTNFNADDKSFNLFKVVTYEKAIQQAIEYGKTLAIKSDANPSQNMTSNYIASKDNKGIESMSPTDWQNVKG